MTDRIKSSAGNWPEDFSGENGNYQRRCSTCGNLFLGYKRRLTCKVCAAGPRSGCEVADMLAGHPPLPDAQPTPKGWANLSLAAWERIDELEHDLAAKDAELANAIRFHTDEYHNRINLEAELRRECTDADRVCLALGLTIEQARTEGGSLHVPRILNHIQETLAANKERKL